MGIPGEPGDDPAHSRGDANSPQPEVVTACREQAAEYIEAAGWLRVRPIVLHRGSVYDGRMALRFTSPCSEPRLSLSRSRVPFSNEVLEPSATGLPSTELPAWRDRLHGFSVAAVALGRAGGGLGLARAFARPALEALCAISRRSPTRRSGCCRPQAGVVLRRDGSRASPLLVRPGGRTPQASRCCGALRSSGLAFFRVL